MKLLLFVTLCYGFWWLEPVPGRVEWHTDWEMFHLARHILDYHQGDRLVECLIQYFFMRSHLIIECPPTANYQPPTLAEAREIVEKIPEHVQRYRKRQLYSGIDIWTRNVLVALWNRCSPTNMTWEQIIDQLPQL